MKILFSLSWTKPENPTRKSFRQAEYQTLFQEYVLRISKFAPCQARGPLQNNFIKDPKTKIWVCEHSAQAKILSSEEIAEHLDKLMSASCQELCIAIGGPDGFLKSDIAKLEIDLKWSFGKLTFPHELAAVVASEQIYRAWTILRHLPYHSGH